MINEELNNEMNGTPEDLHSEPTEKSAELPLTEASQMETCPSEEKKEIYAFRWSYTDQFLYDKDIGMAENASKTKVKKANHVGIYILVMVAAFALAFSILALSLSFDDMSRWFADDPEQALTVPQIVEKGMPSSVSVYALTDSESYSIGSGFVISDYGYIVTNYHVVDDSIAIGVVDSDGKQHTAEMVGYNFSDDVAVLYVEDLDLPAVQLGDSSALVLGEMVVSIGTPHSEECAFSISDGIVSGLDRVIVGKNLGMIQTNAPLNPGNSGGPLFDSRGNLVGIVTMKYVFTDIEDNGQYMPYEGISFALPINGVIDFINSTINKDLAQPKIGVSAVSVEEGKSYFYYSEMKRIYPYEEINGVPYFQDEYGEYQKITDALLADDRNMAVIAEASGAMIIDVTKGLGAYGKLERGDVIVAGNGTAVTTVEEFISICKRLEVGESITVTFYRNGEKLVETVTLKTKLDMLNSQG